MTETSKTRKKRGHTPRLCREYKCGTRRHARNLANELLEMSERTHHPSRVLVEGNVVQYETWTPNVGVTELDEEHCQEADEIFEDTRWW